MVDSKQDKWSHLINLKAEKTQETKLLKIENNKPFLCLNFFIHWIYFLLIYYNDNDHGDYWQPFLISLALTTECWDSVDRFFINDRWVEVD